MFISHKYKVIFVHIQKTGGCSVRELFSQADSDLVENIDIDPLKKRQKHCFATDIKAVLEDDVFDNYTKFCIVRNPLDRMLSWFYMLKHKSYKGEEYMQKGSDKIWYSLVAEIDRDVDNFDDFVMLNKDHENGLYNRFYVSQFDYISEHDELLVDAVLKFENLSLDFEAFAQRIGLADTLPHINKTTYTKPKEYYCTDRSKSIIRQRFSKDYGHFGYE